MIERIKRKLIINKKINTIFLFSVAFLIIFMSIGYSALFQNLMISGEANYELLPCSSFTNDSWENIVSCAQNRNTSSYHVGDTKTVDLGSLGTHTLRVANNTTPSECSQSGFSQTACGFVLEFADIITNHVMNSNETNAGSWPATSMRTYINSTIYNSLPEALKNGIIDTKVISGYEKNKSKNYTSIDKLYLLSGVELWGSSSTTDTVTTSETRQLDYYSSKGVVYATTGTISGAIKKYNGSNYIWWLRSPSKSSNNTFGRVIDTGIWNGYSADNSKGVSPAFRIGPSFETDSWERIVTNVQTGNTDYYHVGDEKEVDMGSLGTHTLRIANMSNPSACNATDYSQTGCGFVLEFVDIITTHNMNDTATNVGSWPASSMRSYVNSDIYNALPVTLKNGIINTSVISGHGLTTGESNFISTDKLYLLNTKEVSGGNSDTDYNTTRQLDYYEGIPITSSSYGGAIKKLNGTNATWWLRNPNSARNDYFKHVDATGNSSTSTTAENNGGVSPAFRLTGPVAHELVELTYDSQNGNTAVTTTIVSGSVITLPSAEKIGYTFTGWYDESSGGNRVGGTGDNYTVSSTTILYAQYVITNPEAPTISGGGTKVYGSSAATITCSTETTYGTGMDIYYSFGYATSDGETPNNWTSATTSATHTVATDYIGQRWYSCKVYASDGSTTSSAITSDVAADIELTVNNATLTFDATTNGGTGGGTVYTKTGATGVYTGIRNETIGSIPSAIKTGWTFNGWYTESSGGSKVLNANGTFTGDAVNGYTSTSAWTVTEDKTLYAQFSAITYTIGYTMNGGTAPSITSGEYDSDIEINKPSKTFTVNIDANSQGASITSGGNAVTEASSVQTFAGWTASNLNTTTALYGSAANPTTTWNGTTKVGASDATTYFKNLRDSSGTVTLVANWTAVAVTLPKIEKTGYTCGYATSAGGSIVYASEGSYTPSVTTGNANLYARCEVRMLMQHNSTTSKTFGKSISRDSFESITTLNSKTVPGNAIDSWDVSSEQNGSVMAWYTDTDSDGKYELYIGQDGGVIANTNSSYAFYYFLNLDSIDLTHFDTSSVTNMSYMFSATGYFSTVFTLDLGVTGVNFDTSNVTDMYQMFYETGYSNAVFTLDLGDNFDTSSVRNMNGMFRETGYSSTVFTLDLGDNFDTSSVTNMSNMFYETGYNSTAFTLDLGDNFDTSSVTNMYFMFYHTGYKSTVFTLDLGDNFDTSSVRNMNGMFRETGYSSTVFTLDLGDNFDTSNVTNMSQMFSSTGYKSTVFTLDLGDNFDTSSVTDMSNMFGGTGQSSTVFTLDLGDNFDTSSVTNMSSMFSYTGYNNTSFTLDLGDKFDTSNVTNMSSMFYYTGYKSTVFTLDLGDNFDTSNVTNMSNMFGGTGRSSTVFTLDLGDNFDTSNVTNMYMMFNDTGGKSTVFTLDLGDNFDTSNVTNMGTMFSYAGYSNTSFTLDLGNKFDTSNVTNMSYMFSYTGYRNTTLEIDIMQFDFSNVTSYSAIFGGWGTTNTIWVKDAADQSWVITNSGNSNLTTSNVLYPFTYTIGYTMNGGVKTSGETSIANRGLITVGKPTKTFTVNIDANSQGASITSGGNAVTETSSVQTFAGWTASNLNTTTALYGSTSNPTTSWNGTTKVGASDATTYFKNLRDSSGTVTLVANWTAVAVTLPKIEKTGYTCGYAISAGGAIVYQSEGSYTPSVTTGSDTLYARCMIIDPEAPTISGGGTKIYGASAATLTCTSNANYASGTTKYYAFGYATSDGGSPSNWSSDQTSATYSVETNYVGDRYYSCRVYASDGTNTSATSTSSASGDVLVKVNNATLTFDATTNGGTGGGTVYTKNGVTGVYTGIQNTTTGTIPSASKTGYTLSGWYTAASGGNKVLNANGTFTGTAVSGYTTASAWSTTVDRVLYAQFSAITYTVGYTMNGGVKGTNGPTTGTYDSDVVVSKPTKTFTVNIDANSQGASITSGGNAVTSASSVQTFAGWTATDLNTSTAKYGSAANPTTTWNGTTSVGASNATTYFKNLRSTTGTVTLTANWTAVAVTLPTVAKTGYSCNFNTASNGTGTTYNSGANYPPSTTSGSTTLYVRCSPNTYTITLNNQSATSAGTTAIYEKYATGYYTNSGATTQMTTSANPITKPTRTGYNFGGYYTEPNGGGVQYIDSNGYITSNADNTHFTSNGTLYIKWTGVQTTVTLDQQSGSGGTASVISTYGSAMPSATAPTRTGYTFGGYYTGTNGNGTQYYNASMGSVRNWDITDSTKTLYAYWIDPCENFTNDSWSTIVSNVQSANYSRYPVGCTKSVDLGNSLGTHTLRVANNSNYNCSLASKTACGFVLEFADIITTHNMNSKITNVGGWPASEMRTYLNDTNDSTSIINSLPAVLKNAIIDTTVVSGHGSTSGEANFTSTDKLYLLSSHEVWEDVDGNTNSGIDYYDTAYNNTRQLDYYQAQGVTTSNYSGAKKQRNGSNSYWWLRSAYSNLTNYFFRVAINGDWYTDSANYANGVSPAFRLKG